MNKWAFLFIPLMLAFSCKPSKTGDQYQENKKSFLPVLALLTNDLDLADKNAGGILQKISSNVLKDSAFIDHPSFKKEASRFLRPELDSAYFQEHYEEASLMDETTGMINFIYTPHSGDPALRKVIIYIKPGPSNDQVNRVYMEIEGPVGDHSTTLKMTWKMKAYFLIAEALLDQQAHETIQVKKIIWNPDYFSED